jgi:exosome complex RNA-binding protein Rrp4
MVADQVVGIVEDRSGDFYKIDIGSGSPALLNR